MKLKQLLLIFTILILGCQTKDLETAKEKLEIDDSILTGQLDNGLKYFIQNNGHPDNRIELRLIVNTGSIQEEEDQRGLAHFVEHMAFNGTKNFEKDRLVKYLESLGMGFGPEINAYTSFDETVYKLSIPADDHETIQNAFQILEDWAHNISFLDDEIEKERGVIVEEWRGGRGVQGRYRDRLYPALLKDSRYAERLPIGQMDVVKNCEPQRLRDYYNDWYRPELMAVAVVGDIQYNTAEELIKKHFNFNNRGNEQIRVEYPVPLNDRIDVEVISDSEMTSSEIRMFIKTEGIVLNTNETYREYIKGLLVSMMFNSRMEEIYIKPDAPFLSASGGFGSFVRNVGLISFSATLEEGESLLGFRALLSEIERVKQHGFSEAELDRAKSKVHMIITNMYNERHNKVSTTIISEFVDYFLEGNIPMSIETESPLLKSILSNISIEDVDDKAIEGYSGKDRTITIHIPENSDIKPPLNDEFVKEFKIVSSLTFKDREEKSDSRQLFDKELTAGKIKTKTEDQKTEITTLTLDNGAIIVLKPTDFKADEIKFSAVSFGGTSLVEDDEYFSGSMAADLAISSGLNGFDVVELSRLLTGQNVSVTPWIGHYREGLSGSSSKDSKETMFQLINLYFNNPEFDRDSYEVILRNVNSSILNRKNSPQTIFGDRVTELLGSGHFRVQPIDSDSINDIDFDEMKRVYSERFRDPGDFYYVFTGSFDIDELIPLVLKYIGSMETLGTREEAKDRGVYFPDGVIKEDIKKGLEQQSTVEIIFNGEFDGTVEDEFILVKLASYIEEELRVRIREDLSGTYGISAFSIIRNYPVKKYGFGVYFGCEPGREEELTEAVFDEIQKLKDGYINQENLNGVIVNFQRSMEIALKDNGYWHNSIVNSLLLERDFEDIKNSDTSMITGENFIQYANRYIDIERYVQVTLMPEEIK